MIKIYGIKNCDTVKKALAWLNDNNVSYDFHNYKKEGADTDILKQAIAEHGWETVINRRGTTWRALPDAAKESMDETSALHAAIDNPSLIKRPLMVANDETHLGFNADDYKRILKL